MMRAVILLILAAGAVTDAQEIRQLRSLVEKNDSAALISAVRRRPADARDLLSDFVAEAGRSQGVVGDSIIRVSYRLASAYSTVWNDSFPITNLARFTRMSPQQRNAKMKADSVRIAGNHALGSKGVTAAIALWRDALSRSRAINDTPGVAAALGNIGSAFYRDGELDSAERYLTRARQIAESIGDRRTAGNAIGALGSVAKDRDNLREAQRAYTSALELRNRIGDVEGASADHNNLGLIAASLGDADDAHKHFAEALEIARANELDGAAATALINLGNLASDDGDYSLASKSYLEALAINRKLGNDADAALTLHDLGLLALRAGDYRESRDRLREALKLFARVGTADDLVQIRRDLASVESAMGNLREALVQLHRAEQVVERSPRRYNLAAAVTLAEADLDVELNDLSDADRKYARAQSLYRQAGDANGEISAREGGAGLFIERQQYAAAESQLEAVMRAHAAAGDRRSAALTRLSLGPAHQQADDTSGARRLIRQALDSLRAVGDGVGQAAALLALGDVELGV